MGIDVFDLTLTFNRHKLARTLDQCFNFGCENTLSKIEGYMSRVRDPYVRLCERNEA